MQERTTGETGRDRVVLITGHCSLEEADEVLTLIERKQLPGRAVAVFPGEGQDMAGSRG